MLYWLLSNVKVSKLHIFGGSRVKVKLKVDSWWGMDNAYHTRRFGDAEKSLLGALPPDTPVEYVPTKYLTHPAASSEDECYRPLRFERLPVGACY